MSPSARTSSVGGVLCSLSRVSPPPRASPRRRPALLFDCPPPRSHAALRALPPSRAAFAEGDEIEIVSKTHADDGWWVGRTKDGREGAFPANHVKEVDEAAP